jgi:hypothetical protein
LSVATALEYFPATDGATTGRRAADNPERGMGDGSGGPVALTVITPLRRGGPLAVRLAFWVGDRFPVLLQRLRELSFIHFARWTVITRIPRNGGQHPPERLAHPLLLFEADFDGDWDEYIAAFSLAVGPRIWAIWGTSVGFPGPLPSEAFQAYVREQEKPVAVHFSAFQDATTTRIVTALDLADRFATARPELTAGSDAEFAAHWRSFLTEVQKAL